MIERDHMHHITSFIKHHRIICIILAIVILILFFLRFLLSTTNSTSEYTLKRENLVTSVLVNGTYTIASQTQVISPTNGVITQLFVTNGTYVKKGDPLFHVESSATPDQQKSAYATYLSNQSTLQSDNATLYSLQSTMYANWKKFTDLATNSTYQNSNGNPNTTNRVLPEFTTAQDDWLASEANYKNQQAVIAKDQAGVASALQAYNETQSITVTAPIAGQVINLSGRVNDQVSAPSAAQLTVPPVLTLADFSNPVLVSSVDQVNIPKLQVGQTAQIVFDAMPDQTFTGTVENIDAAGTKTQGTVNFTVYVTLQHIPSSIRPNMTASITIETARKTNVLTIPNSTIIQKGNSTYVQRAGNTSENLSPVILGLKGLTKTEVVSGLSIGDRIIEQQ